MFFHELGSEQHRIFIDTQQLYEAYVTTFRKKSQFRHSGERRSPEPIEITGFRFSPE